MKLALVAMLAAGGCDSLFDIHRIEIATGSNTPDAPAHDLDAATDAANCGMHDEDGDGQFDRCDACPTIMDPGDGDVDHDGVGDLCDPDPDLANTIDAFYSFQTGVGFGSGATFPNDTMRLAGTVVSMKTFAPPERIVLSIGSLAAPPEVVQITMNPGASGQVMCELGTTCANSAPTCLFGYRDTTQVASLEMTLLPAQVTSLWLYRDAGGLIHCSANDTDAIHTLAIPNIAMPGGKLQIATINGAATFPNLIVYSAP